MTYYLDCYQLGNEDQPTQTYGPASRSEVMRLQSFVIGRWRKTSVVQKTENLSPVPKDSWPQGWESVPDDA
jgi:hypothetical protein